MDDLTETIRLHPVRIFHCDQENKMLERKDVWKDHNGQYHCGGCGCIVRDVTDTETGKWALEFIG